VRQTNSQPVIGLPGPILNGTLGADPTARLLGFAGKPIRIGIGVWVCLFALALPTVATSAVSISLAPLTAALTASQTQQFTAAVAGGSNRTVRAYNRTARAPNNAVTWTLSPAVGTISAAGLYTAPAIIAADQEVSVMATSVADPTKSASATVALSPTVRLSLTPLSAALTASQTQQLTATVGGASNPAVTWSLNPVVGSISAAGLYTAPATITDAQTVTARATSAADPTKFASATVTLSPTVTISLTPLSATLKASQSQQLTAIVGGASNAAVTWSSSPAVGVISAAGLYTAPATITTPQTVTVKATSVADPTKSASATVTLLLPAQTTLRQTAAERALLIGAAASADEYGPNTLNEPAYAAALSAQYSMLEPENAMKWGVIHPAQGTYNFGPADKLVAFGQAHGMKVRGHNLCWAQFNPVWLTNLAKVSPSALATALHDHITTVVSHYKGQVFAWDVVNEAFYSAAGVQTPLQASIWYNQPGIGLSGTGYIEQAFRWAHEADPSALLFHNEDGIETPGPKFQAVYNMAKDFVSRGVPIHGIGFEMHVDVASYPDPAGLAQNIKQLATLGLQVHITEMDVRLPVDSTGKASEADLQAQGQKYNQILTVCLQNPGCTAFQTWGFTDKYSWIPSYTQGFGAALPFDVNYQPKPAFNSMISALQTVPPTLNAAAILNAASYKGGAVAPGEFVIVSHVNHGPSSLVGAQLDGNQAILPNLAGTRVFFDGRAAPLIYSVAGQVGVMVPYEVTGNRETTVEYEYNGIRSNPTTIPVMASAPGIFTADRSGKGPGFIFNQDNSLNTAENPAAGGAVIQVLATGGGTIVGGAMDGALALGKGNQTLPVTATVGGVQAPVVYAGPAPGRISGILQVELAVPAGLAAGPQPVVINVGGVASQSGITVAVK
jgi:uncharacterized protein (TIGR03437 family)